MSSGSDTRTNDCGIHQQTDCYVTEFVLCPQCGHNVPSMNLAIHQAHVCGRNRRSLDSSVSIPQPTLSAALSSSPADADNHRVVSSLINDTLLSTTPAWSSIELHSVNSHTPESTTFQQYSNDDHSSSRHNSTSSQDYATENSNMEMDDDFVIVDADNIATEQTITTESSEWPCPRCTLLNPMSAQQCDACQYRRQSSSSHQLSSQFANDTMRHADPILRRQRLIDERSAFPDLYSHLIYSPTTTPNTASDIRFRDTNNRIEPSSLRYIGGGALLGSILGAAGALMRGRNVTDWVVEGAMTGAIGGAIARDVLSSPVIPQSNTLQSSTVDSTERSSGRAFIPTNGPIRRVITVTRHRFPDGTEETVCDDNGVRIIERSRPDGSSDQTLLEGNATASNANGTTTGTTIVGISNNDSIPVGNNLFITGQLPFPLPTIFMSSSTHPTAMSSRRIQALASSGLLGNVDNIDGLSYERLLEIFGDGSDHRRGADPVTISRLPTTTLQNVKVELPDDSEHRICSICLEEFSNGQKRKVLPCLHGFHDVCIDQWLGSRASCPICKHSLD